MFNAVKRPFASIKEFNINRKHNIGMTRLVESGEVRHIELIGNLVVALRK